MTNRLPILHLHGPFRVEPVSGAATKFTSPKTAALLAMLATSPDGSRSREWLRNRLWSDRAPPQGSGSLRQALAALKRAVGPLGIIVTANRDSIGIDLDTLAVATDPQAAFLEGLAVPDAAFIRWRDAERRKRAPAEATPPSRPQTDAQTAWSIAIRPLADPGIETWFAKLFADAFAQTLRETQSTTVVIDPQPKTTDHLLTVTINVYVAGSTIGLRVSLERPAAAHQIWSGQRIMPLRGAPPIENIETLGLVGELSEATEQYLFRNSQGHENDAPDRLYRQAVRALFSMDADQINQADAMLASAFDLTPKALFLAWRAQLKTVQRVERHSSDTAGLVAEGAQLFARALEMAPDNSMVLATLANTAGHLIKNFDLSYDLAVRSVRINPANPMAWWALSSGALYKGNLKEAYGFAVRGRKLSALSPKRFWWDQQQFGCAFGLGRFDEALRLARNAHDQNPNFRPPLRYLLALHAHFGDYDSASLVAQKLIRAEPDFSVTRLMRDREYPASLIHRAPGLRLSHLAELA